MRRLGSAAVLALALAWAGTAHASLGDRLERLADAQPGGPAVASSLYADAAGDNERFGPDVTDVTVANDAAGTVSIRAAVPNLPRLRSGDFVALFLDTDGRRATGSGAALGADYAVAFDGTTGTVDLARWSGGGWSFGVRARSLRGTWSSGASVTVDRDELGWTEGFNFWIGATSPDGHGSVYGDLAPDAGTWSFALTGVDPAGSAREAAVDVAAPRVRAHASGGRAGRVIHLRYRVRDDAGETRERVRVLRGRRVVAVLRTPFAESAVGVTYSVAWRAPRAAAGLLRFCVRAWDYAGNRSASSCAPLRIRRR